MNQNDKNEQTKGVSLPKTFTSDLRGRQSVRATFKLSEGCIEAISIVAAHLGIKQKSLFDHLVEDARFLTSIAREIQDIKLTKQGRIQKTFVISRRSLSCLDSIANKHNAPRDALVAYSVRRLLPIIARERRKHGKRKELLKEISDHYEKGEKLLSKAEEMLGTDDPIVDKLNTAMSVYKNALNDIGNFIERGKIIEEFHPD